MRTKSSYGEVRQGKIQTIQDNVMENQTMDRTAYRKNYNATRT